MLKDNEDVCRNNTNEATQKCLQKRQSTTIPISLEFSLSHVSLKDELAVKPHTVDVTAIVLVSRTPDMTK